MPAEDEPFAFLGLFQLYSYGYAKPWYLSKYGSRPVGPGPDVSTLRKGANTALFRSRIIWKKPLTQPRIIVRKKLIYFLC